MKSFKTAIIALIVLVVAVAGYFSANYFIQKNAEANATPAPTPSENYIYKFNENDVVKIETKGAESFVLELTANKNWICTAPSQVNASSAAVANIVTLLTNATGEVLYDEGEYKGNLKAFGLDDPWLFTMYFTDGTTFTYKVGDKNHTGDAYYMMVEGSDRIYAVKTSYGNKLCLTQYSVTEGDLVVFADITKMSQVELYKKGELFYRMEADFAGDSNADKLWNIVAPIEIAGNTATIDSFIETVDSLIIADTTEQNCQDVSKYGLDNPAFKYVFKDNKQTYIISLGDKTSDGDYYYCTVNGGNDVFRVYEANLKFLDNPVLSYAYTYAFFENYTGLKTVDIELFGSVNETHQLVFQFGEDTESITFDGVNAYKEDKDGNKVYDYTYEVKGITTYCYALQVDKIDVEMAYPKGELLSRITYTRKDGTKCVVEAYERDDATAYLYVDGKYLGGYCDTWRIFSEVDHQGIVGTIRAYLKLIKDAGLK